MRMTGISLLTLFSERVTITEFKPEFLHSLPLRGAWDLGEQDFPRRMRVVDRGSGLESLGWVSLRLEEVGS
jgi:hypothetical protein